MYVRHFSSPIMQLLLLTLSVIISLFLTSVLSIIAAPLFNFSMEEVRAGISGKNVPLTLYLLSINSIGIFLIPSLFASWVTTARNPILSLSLLRYPQTINVIRSVLLAIIALPFISFSADVNASFSFPDWVHTLENRANAIIEQLLTTKSYLQLGFNLFVMALLPAFGEEFFFRGYLQVLLKRWTKQVHFSIFITAFIFSTFHLQFEGFIPRFLLGVILGYTFYWSRSLWLPIIIHFTNNAVAIFAYFYSTHHDTLATPGIEDLASSSVASALFSLIASALFLLQIFNSEHLHRAKLTSKK
ncbi:MAG: lysostaphin resistance A-like protein [Bacteroidales bacterium]